MKLRLDADALAQLVRLSLPKRGFTAVDAPMTFTARGGTFEVEVDVEPVAAAAHSPDENPPKEGGTLAEIVERARLMAIEQALLLTGGNRSAAARMLGVNVRSIFRHCERRS